ncbi:MULTISPECIES: hypothetical protein [Flavobacteriaceae]|uniref:hypothetical protein n=1 Tax=Flavobacteriaceae TaxID=49546 RepID=UPI001FE3561B|nr:MULTISPECIES: hypothetical protein [Allomuricauda]MDC6367235.1 hypothetical protein [Muricauda sp. AC10]
MSKVKYYYDPDTLSYRKIEPKKSRKYRNAFIFLLINFSFLFLGYHLAYHNKFPHHVIWGNGKMVKHKLQFAHTSLQGLDNTLSSTQQHIKEIIKFNEQLTKSLHQSKRKVQNLENNVKNLNTKLTVTKYELNKEIELKDILIETQEKTLQELRHKSDSTEVEIDNLENEGAKYISTYTKLYDKKNRNEKIIYTVLGVLLTQLINYIVNKRNSKRREEKAYREAKFNKKIFEDGFESVKEQWAIELTETKKELKEKESSFTTLQLLFNNSEKIIVRLCLVLIKLKHPIHQNKEATIKWPENERKLFYQIIERHTA